MRTLVTPGGVQMAVVSDFTHFQPAVVGGSNRQGVAVQQCFHEALRVQIIQPVRLHENCITLRLISRGYVVSDSRGDSFRFALLRGLRYAHLGEPV